MSAILLAPTATRTSKGIPLSGAKEIKLASPESPDVGYLAIINADETEIQFAFGSEGKQPPNEDFVPIKALGSYECMDSFFSQGAITIWLKGTGRAVLVY